MKDDKHCFNCENKLEEEINFCSNCGQKVDNNNLTLKSVLIEFYENYLSFDTKLGRSIFPFLFVPGKLTKKFIDGKRVSFVNPFRFYLVISILFFYSLGLTISNAFTINESPEEKLTEQIVEEVKQSEGVVGLSKLKAVLDSIENFDSLQLSQMGFDSLIKANNLQDKLSISIDSTEMDTVETPKRKNFISLNSEGGEFSFDLFDFKTVKKHRYEREYTHEQLLDTLGVKKDSISAYRYNIYLQSMKLYRSDSEVVTKFMLGNLSIGMFVLIPLLGLILMLFFYKNKVPFVAHLIHSLQLHTFSLFIYSLALLLNHSIGISSIEIFAFLLSVVYINFSLKRVYERSYLATFVRLAGAGIVYYIVWLMILLACLFISFLIF